MDMKFPAIVVHTTADRMETRMVRDGDEYNGLLANIFADPTTVSYQVFELVSTVTRAVKWEASP